MEVQSLKWWTPIMGIFIMINYKWPDEQLQEAAETNHGTLFGNKHELRLTCLTCLYAAHAGAFPN